MLILRFCSGPNYLARSWLILRNNLRQNLKLSNLNFSPVLYKPWHTLFRSVRLPIFLSLLVTSLRYPIRNGLSGLASDPIVESLCSGKLFKFFWHNFNLLVLNPISQAGRIVFPWHPKRNLLIRSIQYPQI